MKPGTGIARAILTVGLLLAATAEAVWPFNESDSSKAERLAAEGNAQVQAADELWRAGNTAKAGELYQTAAESYRQAEALVPNLQNGLIRFRISYCIGQVEQIQNAAREKEKIKAEATRVAVTHPPGMERGEAPAGAPVDARAAPAREVVDIRAELALAQRLATGNHPEDARPSLVRVLRTDPGNRRALFLMAVVWVKLGRYEDAIVTLDTLRETGEDEATLMLAAGAYCGAGRYLDALLALDKVLKKNPEQPQAHINMAYLLLEMSPEKRGDAEAYYKHAVRLGVARDPALEKRLNSQPQ